MLRVSAAQVRTNGLHMSARYTRFRTQHMQHTRQKKAMYPCRLPGSATSSTAVHETENADALSLNAMATSAGANGNVPSPARATTAALKGPRPADVEAATSTWHAAQSEKAMSTRR